jgi:hypothetical protein
MEVSRGCHANPDYSGRDILLSVARGFPAHTADGQKKNAAAYSRCENFKSKKLANYNLFVNYTASLVKRVL